MYSEFRVKTGQFDAAISRVTDMYSEFRVKTRQFDVAIRRVTKMYNEFRVKTGQFDVTISKVTEMYSEFRVNTGQVTLLSAELPKCSVISSSARQNRRYHYCTVSLFQPIPTYSK